jgi:hypothetical protein
MDHGGEQPGNGRYAHSFELPVKAGWFPAQK